MIKIKEIHWLSHEALEADIIVTDGNFDLTCFCQPCNFVLGQEIAMIYTFDAENIIKSSEDQYKVIKFLPDMHQLTTKLINKAKGIVRLGEIMIKLDGDVPNDINDGEFITFNCSRLDIH